MADVVVNGAATGPPPVDAPVPICTCGATERHATAADRCDRGHVLLGNQAARTHGARAFETTGRLPDVLRQTVEEFRESVIADRGGVAELTTIGAARIRRLSEVEAVARLLAGNLAAHGVLTARGRVRQVLTKWLEVVATWDRLAERIGVDRKARSLTLAQRLAAITPAECSNDAAGGSDEC